MLTSSLIMRGCQSVEWLTLHIGVRMPTHMLKQFAICHTAHKIWPTGADPTWPLQRRNGPLQLHCQRFVMSSERPHIAGCPVPKMQWMRILPAWRSQLLRTHLSRGGEKGDQLELAPGGMGQLWSNTMVYVCLCEGKRKCSYCCRDEDHLFSFFLFFRLCQHT